MATGAMTSAVGGVVRAADVAAQRAKPAGTVAMTRRMKSRVINLDAKPERIGIDIAETALIVVDMQNVFAAKGGMVEVSSRSFGFG